MTSTLTPFTSDAVQFINGFIFNSKCENHLTHIAAVEGKLEEVRRTVSDHVLERVIVQAEVLVKESETERQRGVNIQM